MPKKTTGMLLGKFMPPHMGHVALAEFAQSYVDELNIVVGSLKNEPIDGHLRFKWVCDMFPHINVVHLTDENPQSPEEHPDFWQIWHDSLMSVLPCAPDYVFAGEDYGLPLAQTLGATFIPANMGRSIIPVSATMIRENPFEHWDYIAPTARPHFLKRISIIGAESTGKSRLAETLAQKLDTVHVPEYAYSYIKTYGKDLTETDFNHILKGQQASEAALSKQAKQFLICDTDPLMTYIWSCEILGDDGMDMANNLLHAPYDLTILLDDDTVLKDDIHRYNDTDRSAMTQKCEDLLKQCNRNYIKISGTWSERTQKALDAITTSF